MKKENHLKYVLIMLTACGYNPLQQSSSIFTFLRKIHVVCTIIFSALVAAYFYIEIRNINIAILSKLMESTVSAIQISMKSYIMSKYGPDFKIMLNNVLDDFWDIKTAGADIQKESQRLFKLISVVTFFFVFLAFPTSLMYSYFGIFSDDMIFLSYAPPFLPYNLVIFIQFIFINVGVFIVTSFDILFMYLCYNAINQFQVITYRVENLMTNKNPDHELNTCIVHHVFMLSYVRKMNNIYGIYFLVQYLVCLLTYAVQMFQFTEGPSTRTQLVKSGFYGTAVIVQFVGCNCYLAQQLTNNISAIATAAYACEWYNGDLRLARKLLVVLGITQREIILKAVGVADISMAVLTNVFRTSFSIFTFLSTLKD